MKPVDPFLFCLVTPSKFSLCYLHAVSARDVSINHRLCGVGLFFSFPNSQKPLIKQSLLLRPDRDKGCIRAADGDQARRPAHVLLALGGALESP